MKIATESVRFVIRKINNPTSKMNKINLSLKILLLTAFLSKYTLAQCQQKCMTYFENSKKLNQIFDTIEVNQYYQITPLIKENVPYKKSLYGPLAIAYSNSGKNKLAIKSLDQWVSFGGDLNHINKNYFNPEVQQWIEQMLKKNEPPVNRCQNIQDELANIFLTDQQYRKTLIHSTPSRQTDSLWVLQKRIDSTNYIRLTKIIDSLLDNYYYINNMSHSTSPLSVLAGHYKEEQCWRLHQTVEKACNRGKCPWDEAVNTAFQLLFKFPFQKNGQTSYHYLREIKLTKSKSLNITESYLQLTAMRAFLADNPLIIAELFNCAETIKTPEYLSEIKNHLVASGIPAERIKIASERCQTCNSAQFVAGWALIRS
jgi:hypothetical protein